MLLLKCWECCQQRTMSWQSCPGRLFLRSHLCPDGAHLKIMISEAVWEPVHHNHCEQSIRVILAFQLSIGPKKALLTTMEMQSPSAHFVVFSSFDSSFDRVPVPSCIIMNTLISKFHLSIHLQQNWTGPHCLQCYLFWRLTSVFSTDINQSNIWLNEIRWIISMRK